MNRIYLFLPASILILSQQAFCSQKSSNNYPKHSIFSAASAYENQDAAEILRNHDELWKQMQAEQDNTERAQKEIIGTTKRTLKGSTGQINEITKK